VKHLVQAHRDYFIQLLEQSGIQLRPEQADIMLEHLDFVLEWNTRINLTAIAEPYEAIRLHLMDSLLARTEVDACIDGVLCDIGSGAGFPGVPLCIATGRRTILVESVKKKAGVISDFLSSIEHDSLDRVTVVPLRAEEYSKDASGKAAIVTARALSQLGSLVELASPLLAQRGSLIALKGSLSTDELQRARQVAAATGMEIVSLRETSLPGAGESRTLVTVTKTGESTIVLPRRTGLAQKDPLGGTSRK
jgi:16S rRNA (guanine527-N7)-methyltransferase